WPNTFPSASARYFWPSPRISVPLTAPSLPSASVMRRSKRTRRVFAAPTLACIPRKSFSASPSWAAAVGTAAARSGAARTGLIGPLPRLDAANPSRYLLPSLIAHELANAVRVLHTAHTLKDRNQPVRLLDECQIRVLLEPGLGGTQDEILPGNFQLHLV